MKSKHHFLAQVSAVALASLMLGAVVSAHHSAAQYSRDATTTTGVVVQYQWRNPHVYVVWEVEDPTGGSQQYVGELSSVTSMIANGMTRESLKVGEDIEVVACHSMLPGSSEAWVRSITKADGTVVVDTIRGACTLRPSTESGD